MTALRRGQYLGERHDFRVKCYHVSNPTNPITYPRAEPLMTWDEADAAAKAEKSKGYMVAYVIGRDGLGAARPTEADHFIDCPTCGGKIDCRDLAAVFEHEGPLPHPAQDKPQ